MRSTILLCFVVVLTLAAVACGTDTSNTNRSNANSTTTANRSGTDVAQSPTTATPATPAADPNAASARMTVAELQERIAKNDVTIVDVRAAAAYQQSHIKGSINIPLEQVASRAGELPKGKTIVTYCS